MVASDLFTNDDRAAIAKAVAEAERKTGGEIVPVVATSSDRYERAEDTFGLWLALIAVSVVWLALQGVRPAEGDWEEGWELAINLLPLLGIVAGGWIVGIRLAARFPSLKRLAASKGSMRARVEERAGQAFLRFRAGRTREGTGIVLYVSLFERMICVRADRGLSAKIDPAEWKSICEGMMGALREGKRREAFLGAIAKCGELLAMHAPIRPDDKNELSNELRILE